MATDTATEQVTSTDTLTHLLTGMERLITELLDSERTRWSGIDTRACSLVDDVAAIVAAGGKRLRPAFCALGFLAAGGDPGERSVQRAGAAIELLHAFALIHDDVLDNAPLRRGVPTVHESRARRHAGLRWSGEARRYGEGVAILAGDLAYTYADQLAADMPDAARQIWIEARAEMIVGQYLDVAASAESIIDPDLARRIAIGKSGRYTIQRPLELGAALAGVVLGDADGLAAAFAAYGAHLGEAFQLRDDLIDMFGDSSTTGKPSKLDLEQHKMTLLLALAARRDQTVAAMVADGDWDHARLTDTLLRLGIRTEVEQRIDDLVGEARAALRKAQMPEIWRRELDRMADVIAYRNR